MTDLRARAKTFYNSLDFNSPINFGRDDLVAGGLGRDLYVENLHYKDDTDPVQELADQIDFAGSAGAYLFTGNRGSGKTTELLRLATILQTFDCEVFYVDMTEYLTLTQRIEVTDFLISVLGAFSEKVGARFGYEPGKPGFFERVWSFLNAEVQFTEIKLPAGPVEFKAALKENPTFKEQLQRGTRGILERLVGQAREFALDAVTHVRNQRAHPDRKVVLLVDSVERLRGTGSSAEVADVFISAADLFSSHADDLRFTGLNIVYLVPPYLSALAGGLGAYYAGGRIYILPSVRVYEARPEAGEEPAPNQQGLVKMHEIVGKRYPEWREFLTEAQLSRLAQSSGGDLRDYFRMLRLVVVRAPRLSQWPVPDRLIDEAEDAVRNDMLPIAADDREWLTRIKASHEPELASLDALPDFARLQDGKYLLHYRNGADWYDVHPLLRAKVTAGGSG